MSLSESGRHSREFMLKAVERLEAGPAQALDRGTHHAWLNRRRRLSKDGIGSGRKSALTPEKLDTARKLLAAGDKPAKVARLLQVGLSTFYRHFPASERASS